MDLKISELKLLLEINSYIATIRDKDGLFKIITEKLRQVLDFDDAVIARLHSDLTLSGFLYCMSEQTAECSNIQEILHTRIPAKDRLTDQILESGEPVILDIDTGTKNRTHIEYLKAIHQAGIKEIVIIPLNYGNEDTGLLFLQSRQKGIFSTSQFSFLQAIGQQFAIAVNNIIAIEKLKQSEEEKRLQLQLNNALIDYRERSEMCRMLAEQINKIVPFTYFEILFWDKEEDTISVIMLEKKSHHDFRDIKDKLEKYYGSLDKYRQLLKQHDLKFLDFKKFSFSELRDLAKSSELFHIAWDCFGVRSFLKFPVRNRNDKVIRIMLFDTRKNAFSDEHIAKLNVIAPQILLSLENLFAYERIEKLKEDLEREKIYLTEEIKTTHNFEDIIGSSKPIKKILKKAEQVAPTDATVLIHGESGTGKELIARAIHNISRRDDRPLIKVDCATLSTSLIESELFGHEKGSYTGASNQRIGKFELANNGTIFLDEVGELPLEQQIKLLRVLQEQQIERLGSNEVITIDVRVIAATNRDLQNDIKKGKFRQDLFYRLNVFPIEMPPLRTRKDDIPKLANYFLRKSSKKVGKQIDSISKFSMEQLLEYDWPGNVRELEHVIERAVILENTSTLHIPTLNESLVLEQPNSTNSQALKTLDESQREHILKALRRCEGRIRGEGGAAELLDIKPTTLESRMKRLGIKKKYT